MVKLSINVDVDDLERAISFYGQTFGLTIGRRLGRFAVELVGAGSPIYLLAKPAASAPFPGSTATRT
ncbi:MAG: VOC family protein, partial [Bdellovibrionota bacterium]